MDTREGIIKDLQKQASKVLALKKEHRQKRPIVIEFSGSPKSGKTSCINSLELFLKRNGFKVKTVQERASICPVSDKLSPMFNIWTSCASLTGMVGTLEDKDNVIDVLILDRGIFDSLCWFNWLVKKGKMEQKQEEILEGFLLMEDLVKSIDIVFAFTVDAEVSIEREYTHLLTDKFGTIMNKKVLDEYKESVCEMAKSKSGYFHEVFTIDTSKIGQDEVGKQVTQNTLEALKGLLMEQIGYFEKDKVLADRLKKGNYFEYNELEDIIPKMMFDLRERVEQKNEYLQPIPVAIITNKDKNQILVIKKNKEAMSKTSPEKDKVLVYVGGHPRYEDMTEKTSNDFLSICKKTLRREVKEEIGISIAVDSVEPFFIYTDDSERSKKHIAVCFIIEQDVGVRLSLDSHELVQRKGKSKSGKFMSLEELRENESSLENWSKIILNKKFNMSFPVNLQIYEVPEGRVDNDQ